MCANFVFSAVGDFGGLALDLSGEGHGGVMQRGGGAGHKVVGVLLDQLGGGLKVANGPVNGVIEAVRRGEMDGMVENVGHGVGSRVWLCGGTSVLTDIRLLRQARKLRAMALQGLLFRGGDWVVSDDRRR